MKSFWEIFWVGNRQWKLVSNLCELWYPIHIRIQQQQSACIFMAGGILIQIAFSMNDKLQKKNRMRQRGATSCFGFSGMQTRFESRRERMPLMLTSTSMSLRSPQLDHLARSYKRLLFSAKRIPRELATKKLTVLHPPWSFSLPLLCPRFLPRPLVTKFVYYS